MPAADFRAAGLCAQTDPEAFHPDAGGSPEPAKAVCRHCPVRADCLDYALDHDERLGVWGGTSPRERAQLRKRQGRPTRAERDREDKRETARRMHAAGRSKTDICRALRLSGATLNRYLTTQATGGRR